ncbi:hypothetical protein [Bacillus hominis]|uniref:hypothetical protein n=1 Tax=Bacillus hominis TaxID=2817478 RepID=UPI001BB41DD7|nr:hypothetical protein [Bacillus hominis]
MLVKFIHIKNGEEQTLLPNNLLTIPGTGDIIESPVPGGDIYKVESVVHQNIFNSPGEHSIVVNLIKL